MRIIQGTTEFKLENKSAVAIGKFDGMHLGHSKLLENILNQKENGIIPVIFTFDPAPEAYFSKKTLKGLMTREEKRSTFESMGIEVMIEFPLNEETVAISPERFITEYLVEKLNAAVIVAGTDISFGDRGAGDAALLERMSKDCGYGVKIIDKVTFEGKEISSTLIRELLKQGEIESVTALMGAPYQVSGTVMHGKRLGRQLGMPTVNIVPSEEKLLPPTGVYYSYVWLEGVRYAAVSNIGCKPTVTDENVMGVETYLYDFDGDVYGKEIMIELLYYRRPEMKFSGVDALKAQMQEDIAAGLAFHKNKACHGV